jgi:predicted PurR-regulated permease PerM
MSLYPTLWQKKVLWAALTALAIFFLGALGVYIIYGTALVLRFLQPLLIPVVVAGILAYLLDPVVEWLCHRGVKRTNAVIYVFGLVLLPMIGIGFWITPQIYHQSVALGKDVPNYVESTRHWILNTIQKYQQIYANNPYIRDAIQKTGDWVQEQLPTLPGKIWAFISNSVEGFLGAFGFLLGLVLVPISLYVFLKDARTISENWSDYLPLRASAFKDEVVSCLTEINSYLIAFFRGQLLVSLVDGALLGIALIILGLKFGMLIGIMVAVLALIPYLGVILCWIPAVVIAAVQWQDWHHPIYVTLIFVAVQQFESWLISPKIVGNSVGLHPLTVMVAVLGWSLLIGGLLGAILAVPLTAALKVLLKRYVWQRGFEDATKRPVKLEGTGAVKNSKPAS